MAAEKKGVHGVVGEDVYYNDGTLYGNLKLFSDNLSQEIDSKQKVELSCGYACSYELSSGIWNGIRYDAIQRNIRGNHLASVPEGRMGPDVAVLDHLVFTADAKDIQMPEPEKKDEDKKEMSLDDVMSWVKENGPKMQKMQDMLSKHFGAKDESKEESDPAKDPAPEGKVDGEKEAGDRIKGMNDKDDECGKDDDDTDEMAADAAISGLRTEIQNMKSNGVKAILGEIKQRDSLASKISQYVGAFDHADKTLDEVAQYGVQKLGLKCKPGHEQTALDAYFTNRTAPSQEIGFSLDGATSSEGEVKKFFSSVA